VYSLLLVDDEPAVLNSLLNVIPWSEYGFDRIFLYIRLLFCMNETIIGHGLNMDLTGYVRQMTLIKTLTGADFLTDDLDE
jgi:hypothetical protein